MEGLETISMLRIGGESGTTKQFYWFNSMFHIMWLRECLPMIITQGKYSRFTVITASHLHL